MTTTPTSIKADRDKVYAQMDALEAEYKKNLAPLQKEAEKLAIKHHKSLAEVIKNDNDWIYDLELFDQIMQAQLVEGDYEIFFEKTEYVNKALNKNSLFKHDLVETTSMTVDFKDEYIHSVIVPEVKITQDTISKDLAQVASDIEPYLEQLRDYLDSQDGDNKVTIFIKSEQGEDWRDSIQIVSDATGQYSVTRPHAYHQDDMLVQNQSLLVALRNVRDYKKKNYKLFLEEVDYDSFGL